MRRRFHALFSPFKIDEAASWSPRSLDLLQSNIRFFLPGLAWVETDLCIYFTTLSSNLVLDGINWKKSQFSYWISHQTAYLMLVLWNMCTNLFLPKPAQAEKNKCLTAALMLPRRYLTDFRWRERVPFWNILRVNSMYMKLNYCLFN